MDFQQALLLKKTQAQISTTSSKGALKDPDAKPISQNVSDSIGKEMMIAKKMQDEGKNGTIDKNIDLEGKSKQQNAYLFIEQFLLKK